MEPAQRQRPRIPSQERLERIRDALREIVLRLDDRTLRELRRRAGEPARRDTGEDRPLEEGGGQAVVDGYGEGHGEVSVTTSDVAKPTETRVEAAAGGRIDDETGDAVSPDTWQEPADPILDAIFAVFGGMSEALGVLREVNRRRQYVIHADAALRGRLTSIQGDCQACGRTVAGTPDDRLRSGFCDACRSAFARWKKREDIAGRDVDRARFIRERKAQLASRDKLDEAPIASPPD